MKKMNSQYSFSKNNLQNSKKRKKIINCKKSNNENPVKLIRPYLLNLNSISNNLNNSNINFSKKSKFEKEENFEIIKSNIEKNKIKKLKKINQIINNDNPINSSNKNLNSNNTGFTTNADSKSLNLNYNEEIYYSISFNENNKIITKPIKNHGLSARELMNIVNRRKKILGLRTDYSNNSNDNYNDKSNDIVQTSLYYDNNFNDYSNSFTDNNFINLSFSQVNTLKLSNIKKNNIKKKLIINPSKDIVNFIFDEDEKEKNDKNKETIKLNIINNQTIKNKNENKEILEDNYQEFPIFENIIIENNNTNKNNKNINETKIEESLFNIEKNPNEEIEINISEFKIESNKENKLLNNYSQEKSSMLKNSFSSIIKLSISSSSSSNKEEDVIQINNKKVNEINNDIDISSNLFNLNKKENRKEETITKQKMNFFEETLNKISKKENKDKINENLLKLLPPSPNIIGNKNLIKFAKKKNFKENNKEKNVKRLKSFDIKKEDFQTNDYCILKTSSLEKKNNRSYSKNSRNKKFRQVSKYTDFYKKKINEIVLEKKIQSNFQYYDKKKHFIIKNQN